MRVFDLNWDYGIDNSMRVINVAKERIIKMKKKKQ